MAQAIQVDEMHFNFRSCLVIMLRSCCSIRSTTTYAYSFPSVLTVILDFGNYAYSVSDRVTPARICSHVARIQMVIFDLCIMKSLHPHSIPEKPDAHGMDIIIHLTYILCTVYNALAGCRCGLATTNIHMRTRSHYIYCLRYA